MGKVPVRSEAVSPVLIDVKLDNIFMSSTLYHLPVSVLENVAKRPLILLC